jgi:toxin ParE1/3/4
LNKIIWSMAAVGQLEAIANYLEQFNPRAAQQVTETIYEAANSLAQFPHRGRIVSGTDKRELVTIYPYIIRYRVVGNIVRILRIRHSSRRPTNP